MEPVHWAFMKDPCKKCIVKACCSEKCEIVVEIENACFPYGSLKEKKRMSYAILFSWICVFISVSSGILKSII